MIHKMVIESFMLRNKRVRTTEYQHNRIIGYADSWRATRELDCADIRTPQKIAGTHDCRVSRFMGL
jgi:hypothetical protein